MDKITTLKNIIENAERIVFFGGAGVSTESGIPDFRSVDGLYSQKFEYPPETMLSHEFFISHTKEFFRFYREKMISHGIKPNAAHKALAELEKRGKLSAIVTQNIDGLHQAAGSLKVLELHGSTKRNYCTLCGKFYGEEFISASKDIPLCDCGGVIKPDVVLYGEQLDGETLSEACKTISQADVMIVAGTSLTVYPAAGLTSYFRGEHLILINRDETPLDSAAELAFREKVGEVLQKAVFGI